MVEMAYLSWMILWFCIGCKGLELTFSRDWSLGGRRGCGVILCEELYQGFGLPENPTSASASGRENSNSSRDKVVALSPIQEMLIFKHTRQPVQKRKGVASKIFIASLTHKQPTVNRVSDGVKVDGQLTVEEATLRLGLYKQVDCLSEFSCEVRRVDTQGNNHVTSSRLVQQLTSLGDRLQYGDGKLDGSSYVTLTLISMLHEIDNKLERETDNLLLTRFQALENRLEDRLVAIENRLEDKIQSIENRLLQRIISTEYQLNGNLGKSDDRLEKQTILQEKVLHNILGKYHKNVEKNIIEKMQAAVTKLQNNLLASIKNESRLTQRANQIQEICYNDLEETLLNISLASQESTHYIKSHLDSIDQSLELKFQQLSTSINKTTPASDFSVLHGVLSQVQANISEHFRTAIVNMATLKTCKKNVISVLPHPSYPYPVVRPNKETPFDFPYLCDTFTDGGGWIVIQRRSSGDVDFFRTWKEYKNGFGSLDDDFWLGNEKIHKITNSATYELRITLKYQGVTKYAHYGSFSLSSEKSNYILSIGTYEGTAGDSLSLHNGRQFSTKDRKNDGNVSNCATNFLGAWWYHSNPCHISNLNGKWGEVTSYKGPSWNAFTNGKSASFTEMKIRRVDDL